MMLHDLLTHHLLFVGGKGGVGKTTVAAAIAMVAANQGRRCLLVSTDPAHSLGDIFERSIGGHIQPLAANLWGLEIDPDAEAERHIGAVKTQMKTLVHPRLYDEIDRQLDLARYAPGAEEAALLERVASLMGDEGSEYDLVVFDTAPSGHTVRLLSLPEIMVIDDAKDHEPGSRDSRIHEVLLTRRRLFLVARERLLDDTTTAFLLVVNTDKLSILESRKVADVLARFDVRVWGVVVNRVIPDTADGAFLGARREQDRIYQSEIDEIFADVPRMVLPLLEHDVHGMDSLRQVGALMEQRLDR
jgi:arsenite-transporting ATPase